MKDNADSMAWISAYVYYEGSIYSDECDFVITSLLPPFIDKYQSENYFNTYFFIRYSDTGTHIRVRFSGEKSALENKLKPAFEKHIIESFPSLISGLSKIKEAPVDESLFSIKWVEYEPEIERYGGEFALKVAEEFFFHSSKTAIDMLKPLGLNNYSSRLGKGLALMVILLHRFLGNKEKALALIKRYSDGYLQSMAKEENYKNLWVQTFDNGFKKQASSLTNIVNLLWDGMDNNEELPDELNEYHGSLGIIKEKLSILSVEGKIVLYQKENDNWDNSLFQIIPSYIHMMNNRLGISIQDESYLAHLIAQGLQQIIKKSIEKGV